MNQQELSDLELHCRNFIIAQENQDVAHDIAHIERVVSNAKKLQANEGGDSTTIVLAAWLHDCISVPKNSPMRTQASTLAAQKASTFLAPILKCPDTISAVAHAISAHSFSAGIAPKTLEAKIVQDADRLDALGAIGIARCFITAGKLDRPLYEINDPFCDNRDPNDAQFSLDHFYKKLLTLADSMQTSTARALAHHRTEIMKQYLQDLREELLSL
jgi:uncharacterized protein